mgnify:CR=1 FL=1
MSIGMQIIDGWAFCARIRIGGVLLGDLPIGQWRYLRADENF